MSKIEWVKNNDGSQGLTWNPTTGCSRKSAGCQHCYAEVMTKRLAWMGQAKYQGLLNEQGRFNGVLKFDEKALLKPLQTKKSTTWFVNSMSDLFHENMPDEWIDKVFAVMALCPQHTFRVLTKRAARMRDYFADRHYGANSGRIRGNKHGEWRGFAANWLFELQHRLITMPLRSNPECLESIPRDWPLPNIWLGVSVENQAALSRIDILREIPAALRFISFEPLLEDLGVINFEGIHWAILGGESGAVARGCDVAWIRSLRDQCHAAGVAAFIKQLGKNALYLKLKNRKGGNMDEWPVDLRVRQMPLIGELDVRKL